MLEPSTPPQTSPRRLRLWEQDGPEPSAAPPALSAVRDASCQAEGNAAAALVTSSSPQVCACYGLAKGCILLIRTPRFHLLPCMCCGPEPTPERLWKHSKSAHYPTTSIRADVKHAAFTAQGTVTELAAGLRLRPIRTGRVCLEP